MQDNAEPGPNGGTRPTAVYTRVSEVLRSALQQRRIEPGVVLLEGPLAELLSVTRTPVRQALRELETEGLVMRFDGRGYLAAGKAETKREPEHEPEPRRIALTAEMLGLIDQPAPLRKAPGWESIYDAVERDVVHHSIFDRYRINELEMARHFGVGRVVAHDVLLRLESLGLVEKDERSRWAVTLLDEQRINHLYELRWLLEPAALAAALPHADPALLQTMIAELRSTMKAYPDVTRQALDKLEHDLHVRLLALSPNTELVQSLQRTRCILTLSKHVLGEAAPMPKREPFMAEHLAVLNALAANDAEAAQAALREHLVKSCQKVTRRAALVRTSMQLPRLPYLG